jgi:hypothetical protein
MEKEYSVKQLAERITPGGSPDQIKRTMRQIRHWSASAAFYPKSVIHTGQGRARTYSEAHVFIVAVLVELAAYGLPIRALSLVGLSLHYLHIGGQRGVSGPELFRALSNPEEVEDQIQLWHDAITGQRHVFLRLTRHIPTGDPEEDVEAINLNSELFESCDDEVKSDGKSSALIIDLNVLFSNLRQ